MGYTHYWHEDARPKEIPEKAVKIIKEIVDKAYKAGLIQREYNEKKPPVVTSKEIRFNGVNDDGHETFYYGVDDKRPNIYDGELFDFCKTARKPYDEVVMKVLIVLARYLDGFEIGSDGEFDQEWEETRDFMAKNYGIVTNPEVRLKAIKRG